jgi:hypothetical protein
MAKRVETSKTPDGRFIYQIGEVDDMGGGFGCFFIDSSSGDWKRFDANDNVCFSNKKAVRVEYSGEFFATREEARAAGLASLK